jgi:hypothetical protein
MPKTTANNFATHECDDWHDGECSRCAHLETYWDEIQSEMVEEYPDWMERDRLTGERP